MPRIEHLVTAGKKLHKSSFNRIERKGITETTTTQSIPCRKMKPLAVQGPTIDLVRSRKSDSISNGFWNDLPGVLAQETHTLLDRDRESDAKNMRAIGKFITPCVGRVHCLVRANEIL